MDTEFTKEEEEYIQKGFDLKNTERYEEALVIFLEVLIKYPEENALNGETGALCFFLEKYKESEKYFKKVTLRSPKSELASRGLFHALWNQGKFKKGIEEMDRFLSNNELGSYKMVLDDLRDPKDLSQYANKIVNKYIKKYDL